MRGRKGEREEGREKGRKGGRAFYMLPVIKLWILQSENLAESLKIQENLRKINWNENHQPQTLMHEDYIQLYCYIKQGPMALPRHRSDGRLFCRYTITLKSTLTFVHVMSMTFKIWHLFLYQTLVSLVGRCKKRTILKPVPSL